MKIAAFSDTHTMHRRLQVPEADLLIFAGDATGGGRLSEFKDFLYWFRELPHKDKIIIAGNHDRCLENPSDRRWALRAMERAGIHYLQDDWTLVDDVIVYGSPWTPYFCNWAFNAFPGDLVTTWAKVPAGVDILVTHGPPYRFLDEDPTQTPLGDHALANAVINHIRPSLHLFGHIHYGYGSCIYEDDVRIFFQNVSVCDQNYQLRHPITLLQVESQASALAVAL